MAQSFHYEGENYWGLDRLNHLEDRLIDLKLNKENFGELVDTFGGTEDISKKTIKTPTEPDKTFSDDPLRMLRAVRFASQLDFDIDEKTKKSIQENSNRLDILSPERISDEINKILLTDSPSIGLKI